MLLLLKKKSWYLPSGLLPTKSSRVISLLWVTNFFLLQERCCVIVFFFVCFLHFVTRELITEINVEVKSMLIIVILAKSGSNKLLWKQSGRMIHCSSDLSSV